MGVAKFWIGSKGVVMALAEYGKIRFREGGNHRILAYRFEYEGNNFRFMPIDNG